MSSSKEPQLDQQRHRVLSKGPTAPGQASSKGSDEVQLPHERDESVGGDATSQPGTGAAGENQRRIAGQAAADLEAGQVDTDMRSTPGQDAGQRERLAQEGSIKGTAKEAPRGGVPPPRSGKK